ncbi:MAG: shikimate dehydrogenase family protein [Micrococcales bacterium]
MNRHLAVVGSPIEHSKSPIIHAAAYAVLGKTFDYNKIQVEKNHLMQFVETLDDSWLGLSVTAPLKTEALRLAKNSDETSQLTGSTNTLLRTESGWSGFNTDVFGIQKALSEAGVANVRQVSIIGSGATALSAVLAISRSFPAAKLLLSARNRQALKDLVQFAKIVGLQSVRTVSARKALTKSDLVISTLPSGALDSDISRLNLSRFASPRGVFLDVAYDPWPSPAAQLWSNSDLKVVSGIEMLLWQAVAQVRIFCEGDPNKELLNEAAVILAMRNSIGLI